VDFLGFLFWRQGRVITMATPNRNHEIKQEKTFIELAAIFLDILKTSERMKSFFFI
jgi:hypothetical protein